MDSSFSIDVAFNMPFYLGLTVTFHILLSITFLGFKNLLYQLGTFVRGLRNGKGGVGTSVMSRYDLTPSDTTLPFLMKRRQFPVIPAFAMTINKSQGQSFIF